MGYSQCGGQDISSVGTAHVKIAIRFQGANGPVVFDCARRDYPASFEVPAIIREHARRLGVTPAGDLHPVVFLNREVERPEDLLAIEAKEARVLCAKLRAAGPATTPEGGIPLRTPKTGR